METKHTPGPWRYSEKYEPFGIVWAHKVPIAEAAGNSLHSDEQRANAKLIAAAPELLAALQWFHPRPGVWRTPDDAKAAEIEAIIAKAQG